MQPPPQPQPGVCYPLIYNQGYQMLQPQTTVVIGQPVAVGLLRYDLSGVREFTYDLCDCCGDCQVCMHLPGTYVLYCAVYITVFLDFSRLFLVSYISEAKPSVRCNLTGCYGWFCIECMEFDSKYFHCIHTSLFLSERLEKCVVTLLDIPMQLPIRWAKMPVGKSI